MDFQQRKAREYRFMEGEMSDGVVITLMICVTLIALSAIGRKRNK
jgi:hypothetical protein